MKVNLKEYRKLLSFRRRLFSLKFILLFVICISSYIFVTESHTWSSTGWYLFTSKSGLGRITTKHWSYISGGIFLFYSTCLLIPVSFITKSFNYRYWKKSQNIVELWNMYAIPVNYSQIMYEFPGVKVRQTLKYFSELVYRNIIQLNMVEDMK